MDFILQRLREPSTYAGIAAFLAGFGLLGLTEQDWNQVFGAIAAVAAAVAVFVSARTSALETGRPRCSPRTAWVMPNFVAPPGSAG